MFARKCTVFACKHLWKTRGMSESISLTAKKGGAMKIALKKEESVSEYRFFIEDMNNGAVVFNDEGLITDTNEKFCNMLGYAKNEITGTYLTSFLIEKNKRQFTEKLKKRNGKHRLNFGLSCKTKKGVEINFLMTLIPAYTQKDLFNKFIAIFFDITHYKQMERDLKRKEKELDLVTEKLEDIRAMLSLLIENTDSQRIQNIPIFRKSTPGSKSKLTRSELLIAEMVNRGKTTKEIAQSACISERTVSTTGKILEERRAWLRAKLPNKEISFRFSAIGRANIIGKYSMPLSIF